MLVRFQFRDALTDRRYAHPGLARDRRYTAPSRRTRLGRHIKATLTLVELTRQRPEPLTDRTLIDHASLFHTSEAKPATLFIYEP